MSLRWSAAVAWALEAAVEQGAGLLELVVAEMS
jgi:hypothetical protein